MAIGREEVLSILQDPKLADIDFWMGGLHIHADGYRRVAEAIRNKKILIIRGDDPNWATYFPKEGSIERSDGTLVRVPADSLIVPNVQTADLDDKALIIHECTHAYMDICMATATTEITSEAAAYTAQITYLMMYCESLKPGRDHTQRGRMLYAVGELVAKFNLHKPAGRGRKLAWVDYEHLRGIIHRVPRYCGKGLDELITANGVGT